MISSIIDFFSTKSVTKKIMNKTLSENEIFIYLYIVIVGDAFNFSMKSLSLVGSELTYVNQIVIWENAILSGIALLVLFIANGGIKGHDFSAKFFAFSVTVGIKYQIALGVLNKLIGLINIVETVYLEVILWWLINAVMIGNIAYCISKTDLDSHSL